MRVFGHYVRASRVRLFVAEQAAASVLFLAAIASGGLSGPWALATAVGATLALQSAFYLADLYEPTETVEEGRWLVAIGLGVLLSSLVWSLSKSSWPGLWLVASALASIVAVLLRSLALARPRRAVVLGTGPLARAVGGLREALIDCHVIGYVAEPSLPDGATPDATPSELPLLLDRGEIDGVARRMRADLLVVATDAALPEEALARARAEGVEVVSAAGFAARFGRRLPPELLGKSELVFGEGFSATFISDFVQRALDMAVAVTLLVLSAPLLLLAMLAVKLDSPGPVFYSQERVGKGGRVYRITKLRSMRTDAEKAGLPQWAQKSDPRVTRVGAFLRKSRIDELPQVFSVLRGDMSMVGPRPERPYFVEQLKQQIPLYGLREAVKPGVTGWAQICYPYGATVDDARKKLEYDLYYIRHRSLFLNLSIVFHTARTVLLGRGAR
jgi:exopolysaccharide biosynthesis polyprenyl glycosylphosphotransferase